MNTAEAGAAPGTFTGPHPAESRVTVRGRRFAGEPTFVAIDPLPPAEVLVLVKIHSDAGRARSVHRAPDARAASDRADGGRSRRRRRLVRRGAGAGVPARQVGARAARAGADRRPDDRALADGTIIRTHGPRPTWHFIAAADSRWVLTAVGPGSTCGRADVPEFEIDAALMTRVRRVSRRRSVAAIPDARGDRRRRSRRRASRPPASASASWCFGPSLTSRVQRAAPGQAFTYALFDERVRGALVLSPDEARTALAARYVASHGPVTINDFVWWSGLTVGEAKRAFEAVSPALRTERLGTIPTGRPRRADKGRGRCQRSIC